MHNQKFRATTQFDLRAPAHRYDGVIERVIGAASAQPPVQLAQWAIGWQAEHS
jgi:hypothetical protein